MTMKINDFRMIYSYFYGFKLGHCTVQAAKNIDKTFGEGSSNRRTIHCWFSKFSLGDTMLEDLS